MYMDCQNRGGGKSREKLLMDMGFLYCVMEVLGNVYQKLYEGLNLFI